MNPLRKSLFLAAVILGLSFPAAAWGQISGTNANPSPLVIDLKTPDGTILKASYFASAKSGAGVLLFHQSNRDRKSWDEVAEQLRAAGINTLSVDNRAHGESGGKYDNWTDPEPQQAKEKWQADVETAFQFLAAQPGVNHSVIGVGGAGLLGVFNSVEVARRHPDEVKSLVMLSGETFRDGLMFLHQATQLPEFFAVDDTDEYPPTVEAMELLYVTSSSPSKKFVHYSASQEAPWLWFEPLDIGKVPANGAHGTDMFKTHPELPGMIVDWFVTTLMKTPGHAQADTLAAGAVLNQLETLGGAEQVAKELAEVRRRDPKAQLFPEISASIVGFDFMRAGDVKSAIEVLKVVLQAYPDSADANDNIADAYLKNGQNGLARQSAQRALAILDSPGVPASSWSDTEQQRAQIRRDAEKVLEKTASKQQ